MTFDDGPHATNTPRLLDILKERNIKATFYVVGDNARRYPHILRRMVAEGHEIGNHTTSHDYLTKLSHDQLRRDLSMAHQAIVSATGVPPRTLRPPYGAITSDLKVFIKSEFGYPCILWSVDPEDWKRPGVSVVTSRLVSGARPGGILLAHDIHAPTIQAIPSALDQLLAKGYHFVTVTQLIALEGQG
ncbi:MAG: polysaccharide deacetylase family protein [Verrucomicrobiae bacterium]|nr:polysaccharide deacetylase family protein [Verrucomicrobiae bacterium]